MSPPTLRLVEVAVQPVFMLDDGTTLTKIEHNATVIPATEWPTYSGQRFPAEVAAWQANIDAEHNTQLDGAKQEGTVEINQENTHGDNVVNTDAQPPQPQVHDSDKTAAEQTVQEPSAAEQAAQAEPPVE